MRGSYVTAGIVAGVGLLVALVWGGLGLWSLVGDVREMPRTAVPGEVTVEVDEPDGYVVYHERETWFATFPDDPDVEVAVSGPDGQPVTVSEYRGDLQYRTPNRAGQALVTFDAEEAGEHTVTVDGDGHGTVAVGPSIVIGVLGSIVGPALVLLVSLTAAATIVAFAIRGRGTRRA